MGKPTICTGKNKGAGQLSSTVKLISAFVFATWIVQFLYFLNSKFPASSHPLCFYSLVCVGPVRKSHCWFSHKAAHMIGSSPQFLPRPIRIPEGLKFVFLLDKMFSNLIAICIISLHFFFSRKHSPLMQRYYLQCRLMQHHMSRIMRKPDFFICENKGADQLCS